MLGRQIVNSALPHRAHSMQISARGRQTRNAGGQGKISIQENNEYITHTSCAEPHILHAQNRNGQTERIAPHTQDKERVIDKPPTWCNYSCNHCYNFGIFFKFVEIGGGANVPPLIKQYQYRSNTNKSSNPWHPHPAKEGPYENVGLLNRRVKKRRLVQKGRETLIRDQKPSSGQFKKAQNKSQKTPP